MMLLRWLLALVLAIASVPAFTAAAGSLHESPGARSARARHAARLQERRWIHELAAAGHAQVIAGKLALVRGSRLEVRAFGKRLMNSRRTVGRQLSLLSLRTQEPVPGRPDRADEAAITRLRSLRGAAFDQAFLQHFGIELQERELAVHRAALSRSGTSRGLLELARRMKPTLERQLDVARDLIAAAGVPAQAAGAAPASAPVPPLHAPVRPDAGPVQAPARNWDENERDAMQGVTRATEIVRSMKEDLATDALLRQARGVLVWTRYARGSLVLGLRHARGVLVTRHGSGFSAPAFYRMDGASIGLQAGAATGAMVYLLMTDQAVRQFRSTRELSFDALAAVTLGWRSVQDQASVGKVQDLVVWSATRGALASAAIGASRIVPDAAANRAYYGREISSSEILGGLVENPHDAVLARMLGS